MKLFQLERIEDSGGRSGTGIVAQGVQFDSGWVAMTWIHEIKSMTFFPSMDNVEYIHTHDGKSRIVWL